MVSLPREIGSPRHWRAKRYSIDSVSAAVEWERYRKHVSSENSRASSLLLRTWALPRFPDLAGFSWLPLALPTLAGFPWLPLALPALSGPSWLSLARPGSLWPALALWPVLALPGPSWPVLALSGSLWLSPVLALAGSRRPFPGPQLPPGRAQAGPKKRLYLKDAVVVVIVASERSPQYQSNSTG